MVMIGICLYGTDAGCQWPDINPLIPLRPASSELCVRGRPSASLTMETSLKSEKGVPDPMSVHIFPFLFRPTGTALCVRGRLSDPLIMNTSVIPEWIITTTESSQQPLSTTRAYLGAPGSKRRERANTLCQINYSSQ